MKFIDDQKYKERVLSGFFAIVMLLFIIVMLLIVLVAQASAYPIIISHQGTNHSLNKQITYSTPKDLMRGINSISFYCKDMDGFIPLFDTVWGDYSTFGRINIYNTCRHPGEIERTLAHELMHSKGYDHPIESDFTDDQKIEFMQRFNITFALRRKPTIHQLFTKSESETIWVSAGK